MSTLQYGDDLGGDPHADLAPLGALVLDDGDRAWNAERQAALGPAYADSVPAKIRDLAHGARLGQYALFFARHCPSIETAKARIAVAREVVALCAILKRPEAADALIRSNKNLADVRAEMAAEVTRTNSQTGLGSKLWAEFRAKR